MTLTLVQPDRQMQLHGAGLPLGDAAAAARLTEVGTDLERQRESYYTSLYRDELGLPDWEAHVAKRRSEEANFRAMLERVERQVVGRRIGSPSRVLVVGGGTGADFFTFQDRGCETHAIEPSEAAGEIVRLKGKHRGVPTSRFIKGVAEALPYPSGHFDFVWSWTVIEHVQDVRQSLTEMVRVLKPGGEMFIGTVDYRQCYEPHYKMNLPCFLPVWANRLVLRLRGRRTGFFDSLALTNVKEVSHVFRDLGVIALHAVYPWSPPERSPRSLGERAVSFIARRYGIHTNQHWLVRKIAD